MSRPVLPVLTGPTAVGKTDLSLALADRLGAEIVSADSRQIYRQLTVGTAKPPPEALQAVPHHFVDELDLDQPFSAGAFARAAADRAWEILARGRVPLVTGGSTLYLEALLHGIADVPPTSAETRAALEGRFAEEGGERLYAELLRVDPEAAATLDPTKSQRLVRALEVYHDTGRPLSSYYTRADAPFDARVVVLSRPRAELYDRINRRVETMLEVGLVEENRALLAAGYASTLNPLRTIGYREPMAMLRGEIDEGEMVRRLKQNSRRYAKRQLTWFRRREEYRWVEVGPSVLEDVWVAITD